MFIIKQLHITSIVVIVASTPSLAQAYTYSLVSTDHSIARLYIARLYIARVHLCLHEVEVGIAR